MNETSIIILVGYYLFSILYLGSAFIHSNCSEYSRFDYIAFFVIILFSPILLPIYLGCRNSE